MVEDVCAIAVTYNPELERLRQVLCALQPQVGRIIVVDNASSEADRLADLVESISGCELLRLPTNQGLGLALNRGAQQARRGNCGALLLMDQDSIASPTMVGDLLRGLHALQQGGAAVAAIGPRFRDRHSGNLSRHVVFAGWRVGRVHCAHAAQPVRVDFLITSGTLIPLSALDRVGAFEEALFIDHVDTEWVLRAQHQGMQVFGDCAAVMEHDLGEYRQRFWLGRWREIPMHKPFRYYYIVRNSLWLRRQRHASRAWKRVDATRLLQILLFMAMFHRERWSVLRMMMQGAWDAWRGRMGRMGMADGPAPARR